MNVEFQLLARSPVDILRLIIQYATMEEICLLDTAMTNHSSRSTFLKSLHGLKLFDIDRVARDPDPIRWLLRRHIAVTDLAILSGMLIFGTWDFHLFEGDCIALIQQNNNSLQSLNLASCNWLDDFFLTLKSCPNLTSINLEKSSGLTDIGIRNFLDSADKPIITLDISSCSLLTSQSIKIISQTCRNVQNLSLNYNYGITDVEIKEIIQGCPCLRSLGLCGTKITDASITALLEAYPNIEAIETMGCSLLSSAGMLSLTRALVQKQLESQNSKYQLIGVRSLRIALSVPSDLLPLVNEVISLGLVPTLIRCLERDDYPLLQFEATWVLTNITSTTTIPTQKVVEGGAIPQLTRLLTSPLNCVVEQAAWALGNIAVESIPYRDLILASGAFPLLLSINITTSTSTIIIRTISNLCQGQPPPSIDLRICFPLLMKHLNSTNRELRFCVCSVLGHMSDGQCERFERIQQMIDGGFLPRVLNILCEWNDNDLVSAALRIVANILSGDDTQTQVVLDLGILPIFSSLLDRRSIGNKMKESICLCISNIAAGTIPQVQSLLDTPIISQLINLCSPSSSSSSSSSPSPSSSFEILHQCLWCFRNATRNQNLSQISALIQHNILEIFSNALQLDDSATLSITLNGISNILQTSQVFHELVSQDMVKRIQDLVNFPDHEISGYSQRILKILYLEIPAT